MKKDAIPAESLLALPGATTTAFPWRARGQLHITVVVKASFAFAAGVEMPLAEPQEIFTTEIRYGNHPTRSVRFTSDFAPYLAQADVVFTGDAWAPPGEPVTSMPVRITLSEGPRAVFDKALVVQDKVPFQRMPIVYERALCGTDGQENPLGVGAMAGPGDPNIVDPCQPARPAGFGPVARAFPARKRLLAGAPSSVFDGPIMEIPDELDWAYFQAAPPDQRTSYLRGDEWIALQGLHPSVPSLRMRLPAAQGQARIYGLSGFGVSEGQALALCADTLRIDGEEQRCTLTFRRSFPVSSEAALQQARVVAGVELAGAPLVWPSPGDGMLTAALRGATGAAKEVAAGAAAALRGVPGGDVTIALPDDGQAAVQRAASPFVPTATSAFAASSAEAPVRRDGTGTLATDIEPREAPARAARKGDGPSWADATLDIAAPTGHGAQHLPFRAEPSRAAIPPRQPELEAKAQRERMFSGTLSIPPDEPANAGIERGLPFLPVAAAAAEVLSQAALDASAAGAAVTPGPAFVPSPTAWEAPPMAAEEPTAWEAPPMAAEEPTARETPPMAAEEPTAWETPPTAVEAPRTAAEAPSAWEAPRENPAIWGSSLPSAAAAAPSPPATRPAAPQVPAPSPSLKTSLYERFERSERNLRR